MLLFKLDENLPSETATILRDAGFDAITVLDQEMRASPDAEIARVCRDEHRILVTLDLDFSDIRTYPPSDHAQPEVRPTAHQPGERAQGEGPDRRRDQGVPTSDRARPEERGCTQESRPGACSGGLAYRVTVP